MRYSTLQFFFCVAVVAVFLWAVADSGRVAVICAYVFAGILLILANTFDRGIELTPFLTAFKSAFALSVAIVILMRVTNVQVARQYLDFSYGTYVVPSAYSSDPDEERAVIMLHNRRSIIVIEALCLTAAMYGAIVLCVRSRSKTVDVD